jgi:hypothetical protein
MKALTSGDVLEDNGYYKTIIEAKVDTIIVSDAVCYKYRVYDTCLTGKNYHLAFQVFVDDKLIESRNNVYKFMTKTQFKELLMEHLDKCLKENLGISTKVATPFS